MSKNSSPSVAKAMSQFDEIFAALDEDKKLKINDHVRLLQYPKNSINSHARVTRINADGSICVTNINMPFSGTLIDEVIFPEEFRKVG